MSTSSYGQQGVDAGVPYPGQGPSMGVPYPGQGQGMPATAVAEPPGRRRDVGDSRPSGLSRGGIGWVGAHGGAGTSTLTLVLGGSDLGCRWPDPRRSEPGRIFLVARTNASGLRAASRALNALREGRHPQGMELVGIVLIADAPGRLPMALSRRIRVLRSVAPVHRIPWVPEFRLGKQTRNLPKPLANLGAKLGVTL
jgi:hypothetical protein